MTIKALWDDFKRKVYPQGMTKEQEYQVKNAFYAGAEVAFQHMSYASSKKTEDEAFTVLNGFMDEINRHVATIAGRGKEN